VTGSITGTVRDASSAPLAGATVLARSLETGAERSTLSDREGRYRIDLLTPGPWAVSARLGGDPPGPTVGAHIVLQQTLTLDLAVSAAMTESVTVTAEAPILDPERTGGELSIRQSEVSDLPIAGRQLTDLALLDSSVRPTAPTDFYGERGTAFVLNGQSGRANSFLVDGLDNNDLTSNTTLNAPFSTQVIREFKVLTHQFAPEFGRASGGILNIVTRQGTNDRSLDVFAQGVTHGLSHAGEFVSSLPNDAGLEETSGRFQTGFTLGGPFKKDKAFYFLSYEHSEMDSITPFTGVGRDGVAGGMVSAPSHDDNLFFRADMNVGEASTLMLRASGDTRTADDVRVGGRNTPEAGFTVDEKDAQLVASLTTILSPSLMNEARLLTGTSGFDQEGNSTRPGVDRPSGVFGGNVLNSQNRDESRLQIVDNVTWQSGRHTWKFGLDAIRSHTEIATSFNPNGSFIYQTDRPFEPGDCGNLDVNEPVPNEPYTPVYCFGDPNGVDDDGDGTVDEQGVIGTYPVVYELVEGQPTAIIRDTRLGAFAQDTWQAGSRWVFTYGLRYDLSTFRLPAATVVPSAIPNGGAPMDTNNIAPRAGFTFRPDAAGKWLVRGGAGMFYDKIVFSFPAVAAITSGTQIGILPAQGFAIELTEDVVEQLGIDTIKQALFFPPELILRFSTGTELDTPYSVLYNLGLERSVGRASFSANVTRSLGYHQMLTKDLNPVIDETPQGAPEHVDGSTGSIAAFVSEGRSWYTGLDLGWRWRGQRNWLSFSYTLSKTLDMGPDPLQGGFYLPPTPDLSAEKGRSDHDRRHRVTMSGTTALPWGGILTSWVLQASSGVPFNVTTGNDDNCADSRECPDGFLTDRPAGVGRNTGASTSLEAVNALRAVPYLNLAPVTHLEEPNFVQLDVRIAKPFPLGGEKDHHGEAFLQVFNVFDRFNGGPIDGTATSRTFGQPVGQIGPPLTVELGVALSF
jgi:hypothetical protein